MTACSDQTTPMPRAALVASWGEDVRRGPDGSRLVYAATNAMVTQLNRDLQNECWRGQHLGFQTFENVPRHH